MRLLLALLVCGLAVAAATEADAGLEKAHKVAKAAAHHAATKHAAHREQPAPAAAAPVTAGVDAVPVGPPAADVAASTAPQMAPQAPQIGVGQVPSYAQMMFPYGARPGIRGASAPGGAPFMPPAFPLGGGGGYGGNVGAYHHMAAAHQAANVYHAPSFAFTPGYAAPYNPAYGFPYMNSVPYSGQRIGFPAFPGGGPGAQAPMTPFAGGGGTHGYLGDSPMLKLAAAHAAQAVYGPAPIPMGMYGAAMYGGRPLPYYINAAMQGPFVYQPTLSGSLQNGHPGVANSGPFGPYPAYSAFGVPPPPINPLPGAAAGAAAAPPAAMMFLEEQAAMQLDAFKRRHHRGGAAHPATAAAAAAAPAAMVGYLLDEEPKSGAMGGAASVASVIGGLNQGAQ